MGLNERWQLLEKSEHTFKELNRFWDLLGMSVIAFLCWCYIKWGAFFAEVHWQIGEIPAFIGEIVFALCGLIWLFKKPSKKEVLLLTPFSVIVAFALIGYKEYGILALRHSALYYYMFFAVFSYKFFGEYFTKFRSGLVVTLYAMSLLLTGCDTYSLFPLCLLLYAFIGNWAILFFLFNSYEIMIARSMAVGSIGVFVYFLVNLIKKQYKIILVPLAVIGIVGFFFYVERAGYDVKKIFAKYQQLNKYVDKQNYQFTKVTYMEDEIELFQPEYDRLHEHHKHYFARWEEVSLTKKTSAEKDATFRRLLQDLSSSKVGNILFRLMIWRDITHSLKPFGVGFGKPFRSKSIEVLKWADSTWRRDGWIGIHNSFLNIIYRTGILGVGLIGFFICQFLKMTKFFTNVKSKTGLSLCAILLYWGIVANFNMTLELPYYAIPIWVIYGITWRHYNETSRRA